MNHRQSSVILIILNGFCDVVVLGQAGKRLYLLCFCCCRISRGSFRDAFIDRVESCVCILDGTILPEAATC